MGSKSGQYLRLNRNILIAFGASITISAAVAQLLAEQDASLNTTYTLLVDYVVYFSVFGGLFYIDNRNKYRLDSGRLDGTHLRRDLIRIVTSLGISELVYTISRWFIQYYLLTVGYDPYAASILGQGFSTVLYMIVINLSAKITMFKDGS